MLNISMIQYIIDNLPYFLVVIFFVKMQVQSSYREFKGTHKNKYLIYRRLYSRRGDNPYIKATNKCCDAIL